MKREEGATITRKGSCFSTRSPASQPALYFPQSSHYPTTMSNFIEHNRQASASPMASRGRGRKQAKKGVQLTLMVVGTSRSTRGFPYSRQTGLLSFPLPSVPPISERPADVLRIFLYGIASQVHPERVVQHSSILFVNPTSLTMPRQSIRRWHI